MLVVLIWGKGVTGACVTPVVLLAGGNRSGESGDAGSRSCTAHTNTDTSCWHEQTNQW